MSGTGFEHHTPGARLWWGTVAAWIEAAHRLDRRRSSSARNRALRAHVAALPLDLIAVEDDAEALRAALWLLKYGPTDLRRPQRSARAGAPHTARIMAINNRLAHLARAGIGHNRPAPTASQSGDRSPMFKA